MLDENLLIELVNRIRPEDLQKILYEIKKKFQAFIQALLITPDAASTLQSFVLKLISRYKQTSLYADTGILSLDGFWGQLFQRLGAHFLPLINDETQLQDLVRRVFIVIATNIGWTVLMISNGCSSFDCLDQGHSNRGRKKENSP